MMPEATGAEEMAREIDRKEVSTRRAGRRGYLRVRSTPRTAISLHAAGGAQAALGRVAEAGHARPRRGGVTSPGGVAE